MTIQITIKNISVSKNGWYSFDFALKRNGKLKEHGNLDGDYSGQTAEAFRKVLKRGWAATLVLQRYF